MAEADRTESKLDELYREPPEGFTAGRDALAKELKADGDGERAAEVKRLRRPSNAAFVVNRLGLEHPKDVQALVDAGAELRSAYEAGDADRMRAAAGDERDAVSRLVSLAEGEAGKAGMSTTETLMRRVTETLQAVSGDEETRGLVQAGRLDRERKVATLGFPVGRAPGRPAKRRAKKAPGRELEAARKELRRVTRELGTERGRLDRAETTVRRAEGKLADARDEAASAKDSVAELEAEAKRLEDRIDALE
jgi:hypothetical protein